MVQDFILNLDLIIYQWDYVMIINGHLEKNLKYVSFI